MADLARRLQNLDIFKNLPERDLRELASFMEVVQLNNPEILF